MPRSVWVVLSTGLVSWCAGCTGDAGLLTSAASAPKPDTTELSVATDLIPNENSPGGDAAGLDVAGSGTSLGDPLDPNQSNLATGEQAALQDLLSGLPADVVSNLSAGALDGTLSLSDLKQLGLSRRDIAVLTLDWMAQQTDLTPEQSFALRLARAWLSRDTGALQQLVLEQLLTVFGGTASASSG